MMAQQARHPSITKRQRLRDLPVPCLYVKQAACAGIVSHEPPSIWTQHQLAGALAPSLWSLHDGTAGRQTVGQH
jgi:hypothetical protein